MRYGLRWKWMGGEDSSIPKPAKHPAWKATHLFTAGTSRTLLSAKLIDCKKSRTRQMLYQDGDQWKLLLLLPNTPCHPEFQLFSITTWEKKSHVPLYNQPIMTIPHFAMTVTNAARYSLPDQFPAICSNFQTVAEIFCLIVIAHETQKCHVDRCHSQLESFEVQTEVLPKAVEDLHSERYDIYNMRPGWSWQCWLTCQLLDTVPRYILFKFHFLPLSLIIDGHPWRRPIQQSWTAFLPCNLTLGSIRTRWHPLQHNHT